jgi:hypothetical protein
MHFVFLSAAALAAASSPVPSNFTGLWDTQWDPGGGISAGRSRMVITQSPIDATELDGTWDERGYNGVLTGHVRGNTWSGTWMVPGGTSGSFSFSLRNEAAWAGTWTMGNSTSVWRGRKIARLP